MSPRNHARRLWASVSPGDELPALTMTVSYEKVILNTAVTWDYMPGHFDPEYARSQGVPTIYANTIFLQGLTDRFVVDWAGRDSFIVHRGLSMMQPILAGAVVTAHGSITDVRSEEGVGIVELESVVSGEQGVKHCVSRHTLWLPQAEEKFDDVRQRIRLVAESSSAAASPKGAGT